jgi:hypothetical protein
MLAPMACHVFRHISLALLFVNCHCMPALMIWLKVPAFGFLFMTAPYSAKDKEEADAKKAFHDKATAHLKKVLGANLGIPKKCGPSYLCIAHKMFVEMLELWCLPQKSLCTLPSSRAHSTPHHSLRDDCNRLRSSIRRR